MKKKIFGILVLVIFCLSTINISALTNEYIESKYRSSGLVDNVDITCRGPYLLQIILRECVYTAQYLNNNDVTIKFELYVNVTSPDGTKIFPYPDIPFEASLDPGHQGNMQYETFINFRKAHHLFGFFDINVKFRVKDDGSVRKEVFHGIIFGISAIILNREGEIVE